MTVRVRQLARAWSGVARRAALFVYPIREMQARQWIATTNDTDELEREMCRFFGTASIDEIPFVQIDSRLPVTGEGATK